MSYDLWLILTDIGMIGSISALIISVAVLLGRKEQKEAKMPETAELEQLRRAS